ncbi:MAG: hypothetical protein U0V75_08130 [Ferruginibacter sp.]
MLLMLFLSIAAIAAAQRLTPPCANDPLKYYRSAIAEKQAPSFIKLNYKRPNNQLMSWPNYPLTATQVEQRMEQRARENKFSNKVAKDIIRAVFSKKKPVAVIPKF